MQFPTHEVKVNPQTKINRKIVFSIFLFCFLSIFLFFSFKNNSFEFEQKTFVGNTAMGSLIAIELSAKDDLIKGRGYHRYSSGKLLEVSISGRIDEKGGFNFSEKINDRGAIVDYGTMVGSVSTDKTFIDAVWNSPLKDDPTQMDLVQTEYRPFEILQMYPVKGRSQNRDNNGKTIGDWIDYQIKKAKEAGRNFEKRIENSAK